MVQVPTINTPADFELLKTSEVMAIALPRPVPPNVIRYAEDMAVTLSKENLLIKVSNESDARLVLSESLKFFQDGMEKEFIISDLVLQINEMRKLCNVKQVEVDMKGQIKTAGTQRPHKDACMYALEPEDVKRCNEVAKIEGLEKGWQAGRKTFLDCFGEEIRFITAYSGKQICIYEDQPLTVRDLARVGLGLLPILDSMEADTEPAELPEKGSIVAFKPQLQFHGAPKVEPYHPRLVVMVGPFFKRY